MPDTYNILAERPLTRGTTEQHLINHVVTRIEEVVLQALPQGFFQCLVVLQITSNGEDPLLVQWLSIGGAVVAVAYIVAETDRGIDTGNSFRLVRMEDGCGAWM